MPIKVIVNGAQGKMGLLACQTMESHPDFILVGALSKKDNLFEEITRLNAEIVVDLTRADVAFNNTQTIIDAGAHPVIGTSGLTPDQINDLRGQCEQKSLGGIIAPNFSIGALLMMRFAKQAAQYLSDVEIIESHHPAKFDAPSGTAIKTAEMINSSKTIPIHSIRLPGILARQEVIFGSQGETLSIKHDSIDRACFMPGIVLCCQKVQELTTLVYGLDQLLFHLD